MINVYFGYDTESIRDIDHSEVVSDSCILSPVLGQIPPEKLSGGVKALIVLSQMEDVYLDLIVCGQNCERWIVEIASNKEIHVSMSGYDLKFKDYLIAGKCLNDDSFFNGYREWLLKMEEFVG